MAIGEHRICEWGEPPADARKHQTELTCRQIHFDGETASVIDETVYQFSAELKDDDTLHAQFDDGKAPFVYDYLRCDDQ